MQDKKMTLYYISFTNFEAHLSVCTENVLYK